MPDRRSFAADLEVDGPAMRDELDELFQETKAAPRSAPLAPAAELAPASARANERPRAQPRVRRRAGSGAGEGHQAGERAGEVATRLTPIRLDPGDDDEAPDTLSGYLPPEIEQGLHLASFYEDRQKSDIVTQALRELIAELEALDAADHAAFTERLLELNRFDRASRPVQRLYTVTRGLVRKLTAWAGLYRVPRSAVMRAAVERYLTYHPPTL